MLELACQGLDNERHTLRALMKNHPFLFRLHAGPVPKGLVAKHYHNRATSTIPARPETPLTHKELVNHIAEWQIPAIERVSSRWVSCSFSLAYVLWEGFRRTFPKGTKGPNDRVKGLHITLIDTASPSMLNREVLLGVEALRNLRPQGKKNSAATPDVHTTAMNFASSFQEVLVFGYIPEDAILVTVPWEVIAEVFGSTHWLGINSCSYKNYCLEVVPPLRQLDLVKARTSAIAQAMDILGAVLLPQSTTYDAIKISVSHVWRLSCSIFEWPHRSIEAFKKQQMAPLRSRFPDLGDKMWAEILRHPCYTHAVISVVYLGMAHYTHTACTWPPTKLAEHQMMLYNSRKKLARQSIINLREGLTEILEIIEEWEKEA